MKKLLTLCFIFLIIQPALSQEFAKVGQAGAQFLEIGLSPRYTGMGEAGTAMVNDANAIFWNPGALVNVENIDLVSSYVKWPADIIYSGSAAAKTIPGVGTIGIHLAALTMGDMNVRTPFYPEGTGEMFTVSSFAGGISFARYLTDKFSIGATYKVVFEKYYTFESQGWAIDLGTLYHTGYKSLVIGMSIMNFGPEMGFRGEYEDYADLDGNGNPRVHGFQPYPLPLTFKFGLAMNLYEAEDYTILGAVDGIHPSDNITHVNMGLEARFMDMLFVRGGYKLNYDEDTFAAGIGMMLPLAKNQLRFDYAYNDLGVLEGIHRVGLGISF